MKLEVPFRRDTLLGVIGLCCYAFELRRHHYRAEEYVQRSTVNHRLAGAQLPHETGDMTPNRPCLRTSITLNGKLG